jgi:hypothetical protein
MGTAFAYSSTSEIICLKRKLPQFQELQLTTRTVLDMASLNVHGTVSVIVLSSADSLHPVLRHFASPHAKTS